MSLFGRSKCATPKVRSTESRWVICRLMNRRYVPGSFSNLPHCHAEARHTTKEHAIAEMTARLPRLGKGEVLLLWDDECEEWVDWEAAA